VSEKSESSVKLRGRAATGLDMADGPPRKSQLRAF
jgi:hypothetical protein